VEAALVTASGSGVVASAMTDSLGEFVLSVPAGSYRWVIEPKGTPSGNWYEIAQGVRGSRVHLDLGQAKQRR
jgi:hypothetical protein